MDKKSLEKEYLRLKEVLIERYDYHFNRYLIMDFHEADADIDYKFDPLDEYLYLEQYSEEINELLNSTYDLLDDEAVQDIQTDLAGLKYIVDIKLFNNPFKDNIYGRETTDEKRLIPIGFYIKDINAFIEGLRVLLIENRCITEISKELFKNNLIKGDISKPIVWEETQAMLGDMIDIFKKYNLLDSQTSRRRFSQISKHFRKIDGKPYKAKEITSSQSNSATDEESVTQKKLNAIDEYASRFSNN